MARPLLPTLLLLAAAAPILSACADAGGFPSLARRPAELIDYDSEPVRVAPAVAADPALAARVAELLAQARSGDAAFAAAVATAEARVRGAGGAGSDGWVAAQQAISRAEAARAPSVTALAELDALSLARAAQPTNQAQFESLAGAVEAAAAIARAQAARIDALRGALSPA